MRSIKFFGFLILGMSIGFGMPDLSGQVLKTDPKDKKVDPKGKEKEEPKKPEWPKKILNKSLDQYVNDMLYAKQKDASMRDHAIRTIPLFGPDCRKAASKNLIHVLTSDPDINVKLTAITTAPFIGFDDADMEAGINALTAFVNKQISTASNHTRYEVTMTLGACGPLFKRAIPMLADWTLIDRTSWQNRKAAAFALGRLGIPTPLPPDPLAKKGAPPKMSGPDLGAIRALAKVLKEDTSYQVRHEAVQSLLMLGAPENEIVWKDLREGLTKMFKDQDISTQIWARVCFIRTELDLIKSTDPNLAAIVKYTTHEELSIRLEAIQALGTIGNEAISKVPMLIEHATNPALAKIDDKKATDADREAVALATISIWSLGQMTAEQSKLIPLLEGLKRHEKEYIQIAAKSAYENLTRIGDKNFVPKDPKKP